MELITVKEASMRLGISRATVANWVRLGKISAYRVGRKFVRVDWTELLESLRRSAARETAS